MPGGSAVRMDARELVPFLPASMEIAAMTRIDSRGLGIALTALLLVAAPAAQADISLAGYKCTYHKQIGNGGLDGLIETLKIEKEITFGAQDCAKACSETQGCV